MREKITLHLKGRVFIARTLGGGIGRIGSIPYATRAPGMWRIAIADVLRRRGRQLFVDIGINADALNVGNIARRDSEGRLLEESRGICGADGRCLL